MNFDFENAIKRCVEQAVREYELTVGTAIGRALEKQIPKKPMYLGSKFQSNGRHILGCYKCPGCGGHIFHMYDSDIYCPRCGQALDWSDEK